ncbi:MAG: hypothetical protein HKN87_21465 [Saprospiraceae bacterium]|nr:hypothetical protein [Saprospiraceae bacterium]
MHCDFGLRQGPPGWAIRTGIKTTTIGKAAIVQGTSKRINYLNKWDAIHGQGFPVFYRVATQYEAERD